MRNFLAHRYFRELLSLRLPVGDFVICGSGPLYARGWIDDPTDLDIVARGEAWRIVAGRGPVEPAPYSAARRVSLFDGDLDVFDDWFPQIGTVDELIAGADLFGGLRFMTLDVVATTKLMMGRERDRDHLAVLRAHGHAVP
ncbi:hypothetical protein [Paractinoplanes globisporus]|uniref:Nucleotidyltransferase family protein n=1 Tax=Paractinoplanes globisporus TaxID=113565 RepID=A0ABW6WND7_9ACTN|nr:hypothetical protein [Actinoplanes globisporus]